MVAVHPALSNEDRMQITKQLLKACDSNSKQGFIPNQVIFSDFFAIIDFTLLSMTNHINGYI
jgi:hypothetical protein